jgi:diguanylate cyclase (GGDEF)-like protein
MHKQEKTDNICFKAKKAIKRNQILIFIFIILFLFVLISWNYFNYIQKQKETLEYNMLKNEAILMQKNLESMMEQKHRATTAIALSITADDHIVNMIENNNITEKNFNKLITNLKENTFYKNIWIQILDKNANSLYRSWSDKKGDKVLSTRKDIEHVIKSKKVTYSISAGKFDLSMKAIVPLFDNGEFIGILEVISHFNSISKDLKNRDIESVVILDKKYKDNIKHPFTNMFIDDYYVANNDASKKLRDYLKSNKIERYLNDDYKIENDYVIASYLLNDNDSNVIGYYIMFKKITDISTIGLDFFVFKWFAFWMITLMVIIVMISLVLFYTSRKQKKYYKSIIDSSTNIVVINNLETILDVNRFFFKYFNKYKTLKEFQSHYNCICEFFEEEKGYITKVVDGVNWIEYLISHPNDNSKVKVNFFSNIYYFAISASLISKENSHYSIILSDITAEETTKKELELLTVTDPLTKIGNRRYFQNRIEEEIGRANRYGHALSVILFDIDFFKQVNDKHGHDVGDKVLIEYAKFISSMLRKGDEFCRIGGEEFIIIIPHINEYDAYKIAEKIRKSVEDSKKITPITMSFGVTQYRKSEDVELMFKRVDNALYKAKQRGRNRVVIG